MLAFVYLFLGFVIWLYVGAQILLPVIYGLPRSLYHFFKNEVTGWAIVYCLMISIVWFVGLIVLGFILQLVYPPLVDFAINNRAFGIGQGLATFMLLSGLLTRNGRADLNADYESTFRRFQKIQKQYN